MLGLGFSGLTQVELFVDSGHLPWLLRGLQPLLLSALAFFWCQSFVQVNREAGKLALARQMRAQSRTRSDRLQAYRGSDRGGIAGGSGVGAAASRGLGRMMDAAARAGGLSHAS